jgi:hypothetical protein
MWQLGLPCDVFVITLLSLLSSLVAILDLKCVFCMVIHHLEYLIGQVFDIVELMSFEEKLCLQVLRYWVPLIKRQWIN